MSQLNSLESKHYSRSARPKDQLETAKHTIPLDQSLDN